MYIERDGDFAGINSNVVCMNFFNIFIKNDYLMVAV
jgi:hypothetical protein